jgi:hypothetical protein
LAIPKDTSKATWSRATTPKYCFYNNTTNADSIKKFGALYNWYVVDPANVKKIAPTWKAVRLPQSGSAVSERTAMTGFSRKYYSMTAQHTSTRLK